MYLFFHIFSLSLIISSILANKNCSYDLYPDSPEVFYINLKRSVTRREHMIQILSMMKLNHFRVEATQPKNTYIPRSVNIQSDHRLLEICKYHLDETIETSTQKIYESKKKHLLTGLCTREVKVGEFHCTMSHLLAIYRAIHSTTATSKYALIMEDDVYIPVSTDYNALAESAPADFGVLQLMVTSTFGIKDMLNNYLNDYKQLWTKRNEVYMWSTGLYLINREKMRPIIDAIVRIDPVYPNITQYRMIAYDTTNKSNIPLECTTNSSSLACIPYKNIIADGYLYHMLPTYALNIPIAYAAHTLHSQSTFHVSAGSPELEQITLSYLKSNYTKPNFPLQLVCV